MASNYTQTPHEVARRARYQALWRVHFWAGLLTAPIVLAAAITGLIYVFTPQIELFRHGHLDRVDRLAVNAVAKSLDEQIASAAALFPKHRIQNVVPAYGVNDTTLVVLRDHSQTERERAMREANTSAVKKSNGEHASHSMDLPNDLLVYVNPYTATVVGSLGEMERFRNWARKLHSSFLQGESYRWIIELGASWMLLMLATGVFLWWSRSTEAQGSAHNRFVPRLKRGGRIAWKDVHSIAGVVMAVLVATILATGLTWSKYAGANFRKAQEAMGQNTAKMPSNLAASASEAGSQLGWQKIAEYARAAAPDVSITISPPRRDSRVWIVMNHDRSQPTKRFNMSLDGVTGRTLFYSGWDDMPALAKATAVGIPFHRGEFGVWNQALLVAIGLFSIFAVVSGVVMWLKRRGTSLAGAPRASWREWRSLPVWLWPVIALVGYALPTLGTSLVIVILLEGVAALRRRNAPRFFKDAV
jgi:uncharacterized iron-regulated membrane protein